MSCTEFDKPADLNHSDYIIFNKSTAVFYGFYSYAFVIGFPEAGGPRADVGEYGDFATNFSLVVGEMWGLRFMNALLSGKCGDFC